MRSGLQWHPANCQTCGTSRRLAGTEQQRGLDSWPAEIHASGRSCTPLTVPEIVLPPRFCGNLRTAQRRELPTAENDFGDLSPPGRQYSSLERCGTARSSCPFAAGECRRGSPGNSCRRWQRLAWCGIAGTALFRACREADTWCCCDRTPARP